MWRRCTLAGPWLKEDLTIIDLIIDLIIIDLIIIWLLTKLMFQIPVEGFQLMNAIFILIPKFWMTDLFFMLNWNQIAIYHHLTTSSRIKEIIGNHRENKFTWKIMKNYVWLACRLFGKDPDAGRDWGQEEKGRTEDDMAGWHHGLDGRESEWTTGVGDGQWGLVCCDSWGHKKSDTSEWLNWTDYYLQMVHHE